MPVDRLAAHVGRARSALHRADEVVQHLEARTARMSRLRRGEVTLDQVPPEVADVLDACRTARVLTDGWFDPWALPGGVDPTGYVKGWAAERALDALRVPGVAAAVVNAAGDIASFGGRAPSTPFRFGVVDPVDRSRTAFVVEHTGAVATSGTYERGQHLVDPHSRRARRRWRRRRSPVPSSGWPTRWPPRWRCGVHPSSSASVPSTASRRW